MPTEYLLDAAPERDLVDFLFALLGALDAAELSPEGFFEVDHQETPTQKVITYADPDEMYQIKVWTDYQTGQRYLELSAPDEARLESLKKAVSAGLDFVDHESLVDSLGKGSPEPVDYFRIAYSSPVGFRAKTYDLIVKGLASKDPATRHAATLAIGLLGWPQFREPLQQALATEKNEDIRKTISTALDLLQA